MTRARNRYRADLIDQIVELARIGRSVVALARESEPCAATIHDWIKQADRKHSKRGDSQKSEEHEELCRLHRGIVNCATGNRLMPYRCCGHLRVV